MEYLIGVLFCAFVSSTPDGDAEGIVVKRLWAVVFAPGLLLGVLAGAPPAMSASGPAPWQPGDPVFNPPSASLPVVGVNYHPMWSSMTTSARADVLDALQAAGTQWVRVDVAWGTIQPNNPTNYDTYGVTQVDTRIKEIRARGMKVLLMFYWAPAWSSGTTEKNGRPGKPGDYARAAAWVADRYDGTTSPDLKIDAIELWNEPDLDSFWSPAPANTRISDFAALIKAAGPAVKNANPDLSVVVGAPASVDTDWYTEFYKTPGIVGTYDALGVHPYQSPGDAPPSAYDPQYGKYYLKHIPALSQLMTTHNDPARIWATEFGWSTHPNTPTTPNYQRGVPRKAQARFLLKATRLMASYPRVEAAFWYNIRETDIGDTHFDSYGLTTLNNTPKPAYYAFKCLNTTICGQASSTAQRLPRLRARVATKGRAVIVRSRLRTTVPLKQRGQRIRVCARAGRMCVKQRTNRRGVVRVRLTRTGRSMTLRISHLGPTRITAAPISVAA
jgi:hypothetical protein